MLRNFKLVLNTVHFKYKTNILPKIVIPVHYAGQSCEMKKIFELSKTYGFKIIEDASHAAGADYMEKKVGFTYTALDGSFFEAGFKTRYGGRSQNAWELMLVAFKQKKSEEEIIKIANPFF